MLNKCPGAARKKAKADDQPVGVAIDMDDEEAALLGAMLVCSRAAIAQLMWVAKPHWSCNCIHDFQQACFFDMLIWLCCFAENGAAARS